MYWNWRGIIPQNRRHNVPSLSPEDCAPALATVETLLLVGGQAVNLWALYYHHRTNDLAPFVSRDIDVLGDRATLHAIAKVAGVEPQFFSMRPPTNEIGVVVAKGKDGQSLPELNVEPRSIFKELTTAPGSKLHAFMTKRLPREL